MHGLVVYVKEGLSFAQDLSLGNSADSYLCFLLALLHSMSYFFFLYQSPSSFLCMAFDSISSNIDEVFSINPSANAFVFGDLTSIIRTALDSNELTQMDNFPTRIPDCDSHSPALLNFFLLTLVFVLQWLSLHWEILIMSLSQFPLTLHQIHNGMPCFIA